VIFVSCLSLLFEGENSFHDWKEKEFWRFVEIDIYRLSSVPIPIFKRIFHFQRCLKNLPKSSVNLSCNSSREKNSGEFVLVRECTNVLESQIFDRSIFNPKLARKADQRLRFIHSFIIRERSKVYRSTDRRLNSAIDFSRTGREATLEPTSKWYRVHEARTSHEGRFAERIRVATLIH